MAENEPAKPLNPKAGGRPGLTARLRNEYGRYNAEAQMDGAPMKWEDWLKERGHQLGPDGLVISGLISREMAA